MRLRRGVALDQRHPDAGPGEKQRERQPGWPGANHDNPAGSVRHRVFRPSAPFDLSPVAPHYARYAAFGGSECMALGMKHETNSAALLLPVGRSGRVPQPSSATEMAAAGHSVTAEALRPAADYPYPWRSIRRFFDVMPETQLGLPPPIRRPTFDPAARFDLVILVCPGLVPVAGPARPGLLPHPAGRGSPRHAGDDRDRQPRHVAAGLRGAETAARRGRRAATSTTSWSPTRARRWRRWSRRRARCFPGKGGRLMGVFPEAGVAEERPRAHPASCQGCGGAPRLPLGPVDGSLLAGEPAVAVRRWLIGPELLGWYCLPRLGAPDPRRSAALGSDTASGRRLGFRAVPGRS